MASRSNFLAGHTDPAVAKVVAVLEDWFYALVDGRVQHRYPDTTLGGWTDEKVLHLLTLIDRYMAGEAKSWGGPFGMPNGPEFARRLDAPQRRALAQDLVRALPPDWQPGATVMLMYPGTVERLDHQ